jgi:acyl-CoA thioesterase I
MRALPVMMMGRRHRPRVALAFIVLLTLSGCAYPAPPAESPDPVSTSIVALGDSVPAASACDCLPYPELTGSSLTQIAGHEVAATNDAIGGQTSEDVLSEVRDDPAVISHLAKADVVEIEVGANDVAYADSCGTSVAC